MGTTKRERQRLGRQARLEAARAAQRRARRLRAVRNIGILAVALVIVAFLLSRVVGGDDEQVASGTSTTVAPTTTLPAPGSTIVGDTPCPAADGSSPRTTGFEKPPPNCLDPTVKYSAVFDTSEGPVTVELDTTTTPNTVNNFVVLARYHYYDGTELFRTDPSIGIIQGGSPTTNGADDPGPGYNIPDESGPFTYQAGDLVMARTEEPNSSGAQFFLAVDDNVKNLDAQGTYLRFGRVTEGMEVLEAILALHTPTGSLGGEPSRTVTVLAISILEQPAA